MAWIYKKDFMMTSIGEFAAHENNYAIKPNPTTNHLIIDSKLNESFKYEIVSLIGKVLSSGWSSMGSEFVDVSILPPNIYVIRIGNESFKFIKLE